MVAKDEKVINRRNFYPDYEVKYVSRPNHPKAKYHIHVDSHVDLPDSVMHALEDVGFIRDDFIQQGQGEPTRHMTVKPLDEKEFERIFLQTDEILLQANLNSKDRIPVYTEGEIIPLDADLPPKAFDEEAFNLLCPLIPQDKGLKGLMTFISPILDSNGDVVGKELRELPIYCEKRPLNPQGKVGAQNIGVEYFRKGEIHATFRQDELDPRMEALMKAMNFSSPVIPKLVEGEDGNLLTRNCVPVIVYDIPFTIQTADSMSDLNHVTDFILSYFIMRIGGYGTASIKSEPIIAYGLYGDIDPKTQLPHVMSNIVFSGSDLSQQETWKYIRNYGSKNKGSNYVAGFDLTANSKYFNNTGVLKKNIQEKQQWHKYYKLSFPETQ